MRAVTEDIFEKVLSKKRRRFEQFAAAVQKPVAEAVERSTGLLEDMIQDLMENVYEVLDLKTMVMNLAVNNKDKVVPCSKKWAKEFKFIELSGFTSVSCSVWCRW